MSETVPGAIPSPDQPVPAEFDLLCEGCGYSLVGLVGSNRCPECGMAFDPNELPLARVPWLYRIRLGKHKAYWRTVWYVLLRPSSFAAELCRPVRVSAVDAQAFRRRTIRIVLITVALLVVLPTSVLSTLEAVRTFGWSGRTDSLIGQIVATIVVAAGTLFALWTFLTLGTDLPTFIWKGMGPGSNELAPVHHYASAPLSLLPPFIPLTIAAGIVEFVVYRSDDFLAARICLLTAVALQAALIGFTSAKLMRGATACSLGRQFALVFYLLFHWLLIGMLTLMGFMAVMIVIAILSGEI